MKEFVGTLCYEVNGRSKIVQFWRMHPNGGPARELMNDIKQVAWLPLEKAIRKLARPHERAFLASAGPAAIKSHRQTTAIRAVPAGRPSASGLLRLQPTPGQPTPRAGAMSSRAHSTGCAAARPERARDLRLHPRARQPPPFTMMATIRHARSSALKRDVRKI